MLAKAINESIDKASEQALRVALQTLFAAHATPVFGAAKQIEHEVAAYNALKQLGYLDAECDEYTLVDRLRVTKPKARSLLYQAALRQTHTEDDVNQQLRNLLTSVHLHHDPGSHLYLLEVAQPLTMDHLRNRVRKLGFLTDGTFSAGIARLPEAALVALIESLLDGNTLIKAKERLHQAGVKDTSVQGLIRDTLKHIGTKVAGNVGDVIAESVGDAIGKLFSGNITIAVRSAKDAGKVI